GATAKARAEPASDAEEPLAFAPPRQPSETRRRLEELEARFLAVPGALDAQERQALWPQLAELNTALNNNDAAVGWPHRLRPDTAEARQCADSWLRTEVSLSHHHADARVGLANEPVALFLGRGATISAAGLDKLLTIPEPSSAAVRQLAALLWWA